MKIAVVTGASSGIGEAIAYKLIEMGYFVYGIARDFTKTPINESNMFEYFLCDLSEEESLKVLLEKLRSLKYVHLLVNCAGFGVFRPHEELSYETIENMVAVNLTAPLHISNVLLKSLKHSGGTIINITSIEALRSSKFSALYSATKSGLRAFGNALFEEVRKDGVKVITINPDMTQTRFYDELHFDVHEDDQKKLKTEDFTDVIEDILTYRNGLAVSEITLRPQKFGISKKKTD